MGFLLELMVDIFCPTLTDPLFGNHFRRPHPRLCAVILLTTLGLCAGALGGAWLSLRLQGETSLVASVIGGLTLGLLALAGSCWFFERTGWLAD